jgi:hypothetical protein
MCLSALSCHNLLQKKDKTKEMTAVTDILKVNKKQKIKMTLNDNTKCNLILRIVIAFTLIKFIWT